jgi:biotin carboxyl carrier protein
MATEVTVPMVGKIINVLVKVGTPCRRMMRLPLSRQ